MLELDDRRLLVELQSLGVRVVDQTDDAMPTRRGGAGPSDALFLWVRGLPLTVPAHAGFVATSPYTLRVAGRRATLFRDDELVGPGDAPAAAAHLRHADGGRRPLLEDRAAAPRLDRVHGGAEVHLLGHARAVRLLRHRAHARRADDPGQDARAAGGGLHRGARPRPRSRRDADHRLAQPPRPRRDLHQPLRGGDQGGVRAADPGPVRAARRPARARGGPPRRRRRGRDPRRDVRPRGACARRARQGPVRHRGLLRMLGARGRGIRPWQRHDLRAPRHGRAARATSSRAAAAPSRWACIPSWYRCARCPAR